MLFFRHPAGRVTWHQDLGGHQFTYNYNYAGWLMSQTSLGSGSQYTGQNIVYDHYANGYIKSIWDQATGAYSRYEYDNNGNRTFEGYITLNNPQDFSSGTKDYYQYSRISYDSLDRITSITDPKATISYEYDAMSNRRRVYSEYHDGLNGAKKTLDLWYTYDSMNRFLVSMGQLSTGSRGTSATDSSVSIVAGSAGVTTAYDLAGRRIQVTNASDGSTEQYSYTNDGYLEDVKIKTSGQSSYVLRSRRVNDNLGRVTTYSEYNSSGTQTYTKTSTYDKDNRVTQETGTDGTTTYTYGANDENQ